MRALAALARKIRLAIGLGIVNLTDDAKAIQQLQLSLLAGEVRDGANHYQPYGFTSNPRPGSEAIAAAVGGNRSHLVVLVVDDPRVRKKGLASGEVALYHHEGDFILLKNGREIHVSSGVRVRVTAPEVVVEASTKVLLATPLVEVSGNLTVQGTIEGGVVRTAAGKNLGTHVHGGVTAGAANTGPPV